MRKAINPLRNLPKAEPNPERIARKK